MRPPSRRVLLPIAIAGFLVGGLLALSPAPAAAGTAGTMEASILAWINRDRQARGLRPLYRDYRLADLAGDRAAVLASKRILSHSAPGDLGAQLAARSIQWFRYGEALGVTSYPWGTDAASHLFGMWKRSSAHWALLMSSSYNYIGIGVAYRSASRETYASIVLTESVDRTPPWARMQDAGRSRTDVWWTWAGADRLLQTRTSGLRDFDVQYRLDWGRWVLLRDNTTRTSITLYGRPRGHSYAVRVRATDRRGNVGAWSPELRLTVP